LWFTSSDHQAERKGESKGSKAFKNSHQPVCCMPPFVKRIRLHRQFLFFLRHAADDNENNIHFQSQQQVEEGMQQ